MAGLRANTFVLCASAPTEALHPKESIYMWGHYGNGHRGIAIEFDRQRLGQWSSIIIRLKAAPH